MINNDVKNCPCDEPINPKRRRVIEIAVAGVAASFAGLGHAETAPGAGDRLVLDDADGEPVALRAADLKVGKPILAFAFDKATKEVRNGSRLHKIMLIKLDDADLNAETKERAASGVVAFSAICTHQACEVKTWIAKEKALVCYCHASKFLPLEAGKVESGPAARALPTIPLKLEGDELVLAGTFSARTGPSA
jgi:rieske iron-sulfur protein